MLCIWLHISHFVYHLCLWYFLRVPTQPDIWNSPFSFNLFFFFPNKFCTLNRVATLCISHPTLEVIVSFFSAFYSPNLETCLYQLFSSWSSFSLSLKFFIFLFLLYNYSLPIRSTSRGLRFPYFLSEYPAYITLEKWSSNSTFMVSCFTPPPADDSHQSDSIPWLCSPFWICLSFHHSSLFTFIHRIQTSSSSLLLSCRPLPRCLSHGFAPLDYSLAATPVHSLNSLPVCLLSEHLIDRDLPSVSAAWAVHFQVTNTLLCNYF